jgi:hypothetical protein
MYARTPRCPSCRSVHVQSVELERRREMRQRIARGHLCRCRGYPFPHKVATLRFCIAHPLIAADPSESDERQYMRCLEVRRGA